MRKDIDYETREIFIANLRMVMHERGLTQKELAALSGLTEAQVCGYLKGRSDPGLGSMGRLAEALRISPALLLCPLAERLIKTSSCWKSEERHSIIQQGEENDNLREEIS